LWFESSIGRGFLGSEGKMSKARRSGITVRRADVPAILGMVARGDRKHDIAAWFGLNQGRIAEVEDGDYGSPPMAPVDQLPPSGSPGPKARVLRSEIDRVYQLLKKNTAADTQAAVQKLEKAIQEFDKNE
jgi:hypothetical protein